MVQSAEAEQEVDVGHQGGGGGDHTHFNISTEHLESVLLCGCRYALFSLSSCSSETLHLVRLEWKRTEGRGVVYIR